MKEVTLLYPHCTSELQEYWTVVMELFCVVPNWLSVAIQFDLDVQDHYVK